MTTFRELVEANNEGSDREVADAILLSLKVNRQATIVLLPVIAEVVNHERRGIALHRERDAFAGRAKKRDLREHLSAETFAIGDGRRVAWLDATVEDHEARITYQQRLIGAISTDIDRHQHAIKLIQNHGVTRLRDVPDEDLTKLDEDDEAKKSNAA